jgi:hypothetical protein
LFGPRSFVFIHGNWTGLSFPRRAVLYFEGIAPQQIEGLTLDVMKADVIAFSREWPAASLAYANQVLADLGSDPEFAAAYRETWKADRIAAAQEAEQRLRQRLGFVAEKAAKIATSPRLKAIRDFRDAYIAHNLTLPEAEA